MYCAKYENINCVIEYMERDKIMKDGFIKVAAASPSLRVADCKYNGEQILCCVKEAE